ncbi:MAG: cell division protein SepF [Candidatus Aenigmarchaeota archaeon]|nr:cell division protein SepF [Candidatus Aenigmarchaeota archaeon]
MDELGSCLRKLVVIHTLHVNMIEVAKMGIKDFFSKQEPIPDEEYVELDVESDGAGERRILIRIEKLEDYADSDRIQKGVRDGNILIVKIKDLKDKDMSELRRAIDRIRKTTMAINGDIAGVSEDWIVVCPSSARIHRDAMSEEKKVAERPVPKSYREFGKSDMETKDKGDKGTTPAFKSLGPKSE